MADLIYKQMAIDAILHNQEVYSNNFGDDPIDKYTIAIIDNDALTIEQLPSAERKGHWYKNSTLINCSVCKHCSWSVNAYEDLVKTFKYCPNCGARMENKE